MKKLAFIAVWIAAGYGFFVLGQPVTDFLSDHPDAPINFVADDMSHFMFSNSLLAAADEAIEDWFGKGFLRLLVKLVVGLLYGIIIFAVLIISMIIAVILTLLFAAISYLNVWFVFPAIVGLIVAAFLYPFTSSFIEGVSSPFSRTTLPSIRRGEGSDISQTSRSSGYSSESMRLKKEPLEPEKPLTRVIELENGDTFCTECKTTNPDTCRKCGGCFNCEVVYAGSGYCTRCD